MELIEGQPTLKLGFLQKINFFKDIPNDSVNKLLENHKLIVTSNKQNIFEQNENADHFGFVIDGVFSLSKINLEGHRTILDFVSTGGMIGGLLMSTDSSTYPVTAQSIGVGKFLLISKNIFRSYWVGNSSIMQKVQIANLERVSALQSMREIQRFSLEQKIAWVLIKLLSNSNQCDGILKLKIFRRDIADAAGVSTESIIRTFSQWTELGIIKKIDSDEYIDLRQVSCKCFGSDYRPFVLD